MTAHSLDVKLHAFGSGTFDHKDPRYVRVVDGDILRYENERGPDPCTVQLVLMKSDLDFLTAGVTRANSYQSHHAEVELVWNGRSKWLKGLYFAGAECLTPKSSANDPYALWRCTFHDVRWLCQMTPGAGAWSVTNPRQPGVYRAQTDNAGNLAAWGGVANEAALGTWSDHVTNLWNAVEPLYNAYGAAPTLPYTPHKYPEELTGYGLSTYDYLVRVLEHLHLTLSFNPHTNTMSIVRLGGTDANLGNITLSRLDSDEFVEDDDVRLPTSVEVIFRYPWANPGQDVGTSLNKTAVDCGYSTAITDTVQTWYDDFVAVSASDDAAAQSARALERATNIYRDLSVPVRSRIYFGPAECPPGEEVHRVVWDVDQSGIHSFIITRPYRPANNLPLPVRTGIYTSLIRITDGTPASGGSDAYEAEVMPSVGAATSAYNCVAQWGQGTGSSEPTLDNDTVYTAIYVGPNNDTDGPYYTFGIPVPGVTIDTVEGITDITFTPNVGFDVNVASPPAATIGLNHDYDEIEIQNETAVVGRANKLNLDAGSGGGLTFGWTITESPAGTINAAVNASGGPFLTASDVSTSAAVDKIVKSEPGVSTIDSAWIKDATGAVAGKVTTSAQTFAGKKTFTPTGTDAGLNVGSNAGAIASPAVGDIVRNSTTDQFQIVLDI